MAGKTLVVKLDMSDAEAQRKVMKTVSNITGIKSIDVDAGASKLTVVCEQADPIKVVGKLRRKGCRADIVTVGPIKDEKKEAEKKKKEEEEKKKKEQQQALENAYKQYYTPPPPFTNYYPPAVQHPVFYGGDGNLDSSCVIM